MPRSSGISSGADDIAKIIVKAMNSKGGRKVRYNFLKSVGILGKSKGASTLLSSAPKIAGTGRKGKSAAAAAAKAKTPGGGSVGRIAKTPVRRPPVDKYPKGKNIAQTASEQRATERAANRLLRFDKKTGATPKAASSKPVDVKGSVITPPTKATMRPPKPSTKSYEADPLRRLEGTPKPPKRQGRKGNQPKGTKPSQGTKKSKVGTTKSSSVKPKGNMSAGSKEGKATVARDRAVRAAQKHDEKIQRSIRSARTETNAEKLRNLNQRVSSAKTKAAKEKAIKERNDFARSLMLGK